MSATAINTAHAEAHHDDGSTKVFGFWVYIISDLFLFATIFANFAVFSSAYDLGKTGKELFDLNFVLVETFLLLFSSITYGFAMVQMHRNNISGLKMWMGLTFLLGASFICMELYEFNHLLGEGVYYYSPVAYAGVDPATGAVIYGNTIMSAFWSAFFVLVGTHGIHVSTGLIWMACMFVHLSRVGLTDHNKTRLMCLSIFWHFLDVVWVGVFTVVYLLGVL